MNVNKPNKSNFSVGDSKKFLRLPAVKEKTGKPRSSLYLMMSKGEFPRPIKLGERSVGWLESDVDAWIEACIKRSRTGGKYAA